MAYLSPKTYNPIQTTTEQTKFWLVQDIGQVELLRARYSTHSFSRHTHEGFAIGIIEQGAERTL